MHKVECVVNVVHTFDLTTGKMAYIVTRMQCGNERICSEMEVMLAKEHGDSLVPECTCPPIPDDVEMSVC